MQDVAPRLNEIPTPPLFPRVVPGAPRLRPVATAEERTFRNRGIIPRWAKTVLCVAYSKATSKQGNERERARSSKINVCIHRAFRIL